MRSFPLAAVALSSALSCTAREAPPPSATPATAASVPAATPTTTPATTTPATTMVGAQPDAPITLRGRVSKTPWQHLMTGVSGKSDAYFDLRDGKEQTVVYWKDPPACASDVVVTGKVLEVKGASKRPRAPSKAEETHRELHVDVDSARCAD